jgi:hypothetical protein
MVLVNKDEPLGSVFKDKIYDEFSQNLSRILSMSLDEYRQIFQPHGDDPFTDFEVAYAEGGAEALRLKMNWAITNLSVIYRERELGREMTGPELQEHDNGLGLELGL